MIHMIRIYKVYHKKMCEKDSTIFRARHINLVFRDFVQQSRPCVLIMSIILSVSSLTVTVFTPL